MAQMNRPADWSRDDLLLHSDEYFFIYTLLWNFLQEERLVNGNMSVKLSFVGMRFWWSLILQQVSEIHIFIIIGYGHGIVLLKEKEQ